MLRSARSRARAAEATAAGEFPKKRGAGRPKFQGSQKKHPFPARLTGVKRAAGAPQELHGPSPTKRRRVNGPLQVVTNLLQVNTAGSSRQPATGIKPNVQLYDVATEEVQRHAR